MSIDIKYYTSIIGDELDELLDERKDHDFALEPLISMSAFKEEVLVVFEDVLKKRNKYLVIHEIFNYLILDSLKNSEKLLCILDYLVYLSKIDSSFSDLPNELLETITSQPIFSAIRPYLINTKRFDYEFESKLLEVHTRGKPRSHQSISLLELTKTINSKKSKVNKRSEKKKPLQEESLIGNERRSIRKRTSKTKSSTTRRGSRGLELDRAELQSDQLIPSRVSRTNRKVKEILLVKTEPDIQNEDSLLILSEEDESTTDEEEVEIKKTTPKKRTPKSSTKRSRNSLRSKRIASTKKNETTKKKRKYDIPSDGPIEPSDSFESEDVDDPQVDVISYPTKDATKSIKDLGYSSDSNYTSSDPEISRLPAVSSDSEEYNGEDDDELVEDEFIEQEKKTKTKNKSKPIKKKSLAKVRNGKYGNGDLIKAPKTVRAVKAKAPKKPSKPKRPLVPVIAKENLDFLYELIEKEFIRTPILSKEEKILPRLYKPPFYDIFAQHNSGDDSELASSLDKFFFDFSVQMIKKCNDTSIDPTIFIHEREYNYVMENLSLFKFKLLPSIVFDQRKMLSGVDNNNIVFEKRPLAHSQVNNLKQITVFNSEHEYIEEFKNIFPRDQISKRVDFLNSIITDGKSIFLCREVDLINECMALPRAKELPCCEDCFSPKTKDAEANGNDDPDKDNNNNSQEHGFKKSIDENSEAIASPNTDDVDAISEKRDVEANISQKVHGIDSISEEKLDEVDDSQQKTVNEADETVAPQQQNESDGDLIHEEEVEEIDVPENTNDNDEKTDEKTDEVNVSQKIDHSDKEEKINEIDEPDNSDENFEGRETSLEDIYSSEKLENEEPRSVVDAEKTKFIDIGPIQDSDSDNPEKFTIVKERKVRSRPERLLTSNGIILSPFAFSKILSIQDLLKMITNLIFPNLKVPSLKSSDAELGLNKIPNSVISDLSSLYLNFRPYLIDLLLKNFEAFFNLPKYFRIDSVMFELELSTLKDSLKRGVKVVYHSKPVKTGLLSY